MFALFYLLKRFCAHLKELLLTAVCRM